MPSATEFIQIFRTEWHAADVDNQIELLAKHARGKLAAQLTPDVLDGLANNPAFSPLFTHGFTIDSVAEIDTSARATLVVENNNEAVPYVLSIKHDGTAWGITGLQLEQTDF